MSVVSWQIQPIVPLPEWFVQAVSEYAPNGSGHYVAQLLWQRGIQDLETLAGFLKADCYQPTSPFAFGQEMQWGMERLQQARTRQEPIAIWGDFDADGVTATAVLWDGLGQFFVPQQTLFYYIPNRLTESHGLSQQGIEALHAKDCRLIVTCDTGSTNLTEIEFARSLGIDVIVTDHHTLLEARPPVTAIINPRTLPVDHPLATLSGVAVAYKLVEALYETLPEVPQKPLETLLDLVAIGLIADLVELKGDCRYLAQRGIEQLQKQSDPATATRPGLSRLLALCKRSGDRPTDISFGLGPRINAVSRIQGDAHFCVELLTSQDVTLCNHLAEATELANTRRKALQKDVAQQVTARLTQLDLSTTSVIVLADEQWQIGVLGLVAGQIAQEYGRPTILLNTELAVSGQRFVVSGQRSAVSGQEQHLESTTQHLTLNTSPAPLTSLTSFASPASLAPPAPLTSPVSPASLSSPRSPLARGSARSVNNIDLYQLVKDQAHLLHRFGGHPYAAGLSLSVENIPLFTAAVNQQALQLGDLARPAVKADLTVTVAALGKELFQALKLLEPCGMGNPPPRLFLQNCWFEQVRNQNIKDWKGGKVRYIKTEFELWDDSAESGFPGLWWEHYQDEVPKGRCDAIGELDFNAYKKRYEIRLIAVRPCENTTQTTSNPTKETWILDWRGLQDVSSVVGEVVGQLKRSKDTKNALTASPASLAPSGSPPPSSLLILHQCPTSWTDLQVWFRRAMQEQRSLAIAYPMPPHQAPQEIWQQLVGIAKYLSRTGQTATRTQLLDKLGIGDRPLKLGFQTLEYLGFTLRYADNAFQMTWQEQASHQTETQLTAAVEQFAIAVNEEQFRRQYFYQIPLATIQAIAAQTVDLSGERGISEQT
ncbi:single-stranded-DNA-specific exonuclease RecJ [Stenomitos frigidus]|uniref:Single-stranded-DNA-specific exonuclease RecJ n=1 Tax=Stenomitos frigidus ULC18 TaxID=2107698 RepID=A0A2T1DY61_9CYAN|nr:DHH family phosphoesterase [Stenomitos frigidus]PSB25324.1 single-stranded-DNA-specific exonuclease RecJ [Stenomitos frigidus ULC18]